MGLDGATGGQGGGNEEGRASNGGQGEGIHSGNASVAGGGGIDTQSIPLPYPAEDAQFMLNYEKIQDFLVVSSCMFDCWVLSCCTLFFVVSMRLEVRHIGIATCLVVLQDSLAEGQALRTALDDLGTKPEDLVALCPCCITHHVTSNERRTRRRRHATKSVLRIVPVLVLCIVLVLRSSRATMRHCGAHPPPAQRAPALNLYTPCTECGPSPNPNPNPYILPVQNAALGFIDAMDGSTDHILDIRVFLEEAS